MSNYNSLKTTIDANIKQNGNQEITGQILNSVLNQMVTTLGAGYQFAGVATTATDPGSPDAKMFYIANGKGTYTNFGGLVVTEDDVVVLYWDTAWHKEATGIASQEKLTELEDKIMVHGEFQSLNFSSLLFNGYIDISTGIVNSWSNTDYQIFYKQISKDSIIHLERGTKSVPNSNVVLILDDISVVAIGNNVQKFIVDNGLTTPLDSSIEIKEGQYLVVGYHNDLSKRTLFSISEFLYLADVNNEITSINNEITSINNEITLESSGGTFVINDKVLANAYINISAGISAWTSDEYNIYAFRAEEDAKVRIIKTASTYETNDIYAKCKSIDGLQVGNNIDGEILCTGNDYPYDKIVELKRGEYLLRSGQNPAKARLNFIVNSSIKKKLLVLQGVKVDFEGDSVMSAESSNGGWATLIQQMEGVVAINNGVSGSRITNAEGRTSILQRILSRTPSNFDMIIIQGGFNDGSSPLGTFSRNDYRDEGEGDYDPTTYYGALEIICRYCLKNFPKAGMIVGYNWGSNTWNTTYANAMVEVCEKWGMPYVDLRSKAGFNLNSETLREKYGLYNGDVPMYSESRGYTLDEKIKYDGRVYKANQVIESPAGTFNSSLWTYIGLEYDNCHCNVEGYKKSVGAIIQLMKSL